MDRKLREVLGISEKSWLKRKCQDLGITCDTKASDSQQIYTLTEKLKEIDRYDVIGELEAVRSQIIEESQRNPIDLIK